MRTINVKMSKNGSKLVSIYGNISGRGFSIQTNGNLPECHRLPLGKSDLSDLQIEEIRDYLSHYGTYQQQHVFSRFLAE